MQFSVPLCLAGFGTHVVLYVNARPSFNKILCVPSSASGNLDTGVLDSSAWVNEGREHEYY
jgi:hypothetical protein